MSPAADNPSESSGSSESAVTVNQPDPEAQTQTQQQNQTQNELLTESEKPATVSPAADNLSKSSGSSESAVTVNQPDPEAQTQQHNQIQNELLVESENPVTLPSATGEGTESADENAHTAVTVQEGQQQTSLEEIQVVVVGGDISINPDTSGEEIYVGQQQEISEKQTSKTTGKKTGDTGKQKKKKKETRDLQKYPLFSLVYPSRRLNMPGDPEAWAGIPGEKIYPVSGTSLLIEMINGGR